MKKVLSIILCTVLILNILPLGVFGYDLTTLAGDINDARNVNIVDDACLNHTAATPVVTVAPTCESKGTRTISCKDCGALMATEEIVATGHYWNVGEVIVAPTCEENGVKIYTCKNDESHTKSQNISATGHTWGMGVITTQPTFLENGVKTYTCQNNSSHKKTEAIPAYGAFVVTAQGGEIARGQTIQVPIVVENNPGWRALNIQISYDADVLEIVCPKHDDSKNCTGPRKPSIVKKSDFAAPADYGCSNSGQDSAKCTANPYALCWAYPTIEENIKETGTYATITFKVKDNAAFGATTVGIVVKTIADCDLAHPSTIANDATINIVERVHVDAPQAPTVLTTTATTVALVAIPGYEYSMDGVNWQTSNVFEGLDPNTEYTFYQRVAESDTNFASDASAPLTAKTTKYQTATPAAPTVLEATATSVTLVATHGYEYSMDGVNWKISNVFENLDPNTEYTFYQRVAESDSNFASDASAPLTAKTVKHTVAAPVVPTVLEVTATAVTLAATEGYEYSMEGVTWQTSNAFENLNPNTQYTFYQRIAETNTHYASEISEAISVTTIKFTVAAPISPIISSKDATKITLAVYQGYEYSMDGETWQTSNVFAGLSPNIQYTFYQRVAETDTHYASASSAGTVCVTLKLQQSAPVAPIAANVEATRVVLVQKQGYEYSMDGETWQTSNIFENLDPNTKYALYQRKAETESCYASSPSAPLITTTIKHIPSIPETPVVILVTSTTITLAAQQGYEYSMDGETWQTSNIFENLDPNTEYAFYQRKIETNTHYASEASTVVSVKTLKEYIPGDINGDGDITLDDVVLLAQFVAGWNVTIN